MPIPWNQKLVDIKDLLYGLGIIGYSRAEARSKDHVHCEKCSELRNYKVGSFHHQLPVSSITPFGKSCVALLGHPCAGS